jgi:hypothetical protein
MVSHTHGQWQGEGGKPGWILGGGGGGGGEKKFKKKKNIENQNKNNFFKY